MMKLRIEDVKATLRGAMIRLLKRHVGPFRYRRRWLEKTQWYTSDELRDLQLELLKKMIRHAYDTVPYYKRLMQELRFSPDDIKCLDDIQRFPVMTKADLKAAHNDMISTKFSRFLLRTAHTGGTTGARIALKRDLCSIGNEHAFVRRQFDWAGVGLNDRRATIMAHVISAPGKELERPFVYDAAMRELLMSTFHLAQNTLGAYIDALRCYKVEAVVGYPSAAYVLAKYCLDNKIVIRLKAVLTTSETLDKVKRETISKAFECPIYDFYGGSERVCYIHTCEHGSYHIVPEYGLTNLMPADPPNEDCCRVVATGFWNMAMPLIRFDTGDLVRPGIQKCRCNRAFPTIERIVGREGDVLVTPSGRILGATALEAVMENVLFGMRHLRVLESQMIQESAGIMVLEYVPSSGFSSRDAERIRLLTAEHLPCDFNVKIRAVKCISRTASGRALSFAVSRLACQ